MPDSIDRRPRRAGTVRATAAIVASLLLVAGCGDDGEDAATTTTTSAADTTESTTTTTEDGTTTTAAPTGVCDLITPVAIEAALGVAVEPGEASTDGAVAVCVYESADGSDQVTLRLHDPVGDLLAETLAGDPAAMEIPGVADGAVLQLELGSITTHRNGKGLAIKVTPAPSEEALVQLARVGAGLL